MFTRTPTNERSVQQRTTPSLQVPTPKERTSLSRTPRRVEVTQTSPDRRESQTSLPTRDLHTTQHLREGLGSRRSAEIPTASAPLQTPHTDKAEASSEQTDEKCQICTQLVLQAGLECFECKKWLHYFCTGLPAYQIGLFLKTNRRYTCCVCYESKYPGTLQDITTQIRTHQVLISATKTVNTLGDFFGNPATERTTDVLGANGNDTLTRKRVTKKPANSKTQTSSNGRHNEANVTASIFKPVTSTLRAPLSTVPNLAPTTAVSTNSVSPPSNGVPSTPVLHSNQIHAHDNRQDTNSQDRRAAIPPVCENHIKRRCGDRNCQLTHKKLCWAFIRDGDGPNGCPLRPQDCAYEHPHICTNSFNRRYCLNLKTCPYRHIKGTTQQPRGDPNRPNQQRSSRSNDALPNQRQHHSDFPRPSAPNDWPLPQNLRQREARPINNEPQPPRESKVPRNRLYSTAVRGNIARSDPIDIGDSSPRYQPPITNISNDIANPSQFSNDRHFLYQKQLHELRSETQEELFSLKQLVTELHKAIIHPPRRLLPAEEPPLARYPTGPPLLGQRGQSRLDY